MALKKSQLYSSLWQSCDELRGGMDASQYKDYILTLLFMKYVSDKYAGDPDAIIEVPEGGSFADMVRLKGDKEIGDKINKIIGRLAEANDLKGVIDDADFNDEDKLGRGKEMQDRLSKLVAIFDGLDFRANRAEGDDLLGDPYEYLMRHFATESGKSKGQFYTPSEVSRILAKVVGIGPETRQDQTIYDPTHGSGSLLLKGADEAPRGLTIYGQEMDNATWALARMNMILHGHPTADLWRGNTLAAPYFKNPDGSLKIFDFALANPPFSSKAWTSGFNPDADEFRRFEYGVPPAKNGDYAFLLHVIASLKSKGKAAVIMPHGVLFRGNKEADIRRNLVTRGLIKGIIGLPANLFYGTGIPACIVVIDKENAHVRTGIFMIDASKECMKDGNKNRLRSQDIHKIVDVFNKQIELPRYSRMVPVREIADPSNEYNLNIPRYIDSSEPEDLHDLQAHLRGGIPNRDIDELQQYLGRFPVRPQGPVQTRQPRGLQRGQGRSRAGQGDDLGTRRVRRVPAAGRRDLRPMAIGPHQASQGSESGRQAQAGDPRAVRGSAGPVCQPAAVEPLRRLPASDGLLGRRDAGRRVPDRRRWLAGSGQAARVIDDREKKIRETPDLVVNKKKYKMDLIPPPLIVARYFQVELTAIDALQAKQDEATQALEECIEEHAVEEGLLEEALNDKGKVNRAGVNERLKQLRVENGELSVGDDDAEEQAALQRCLELMDAEADAKKAVKDAQEKLDAKVLTKYGSLNEAEIKSLAIDDKWFAAIRTAIEGEVQRITQRLAERVKELEERYANPMPELVERVETLSLRVDEHLKQMGIVQ
jgi:type I restriction enzyme M protein